MPAPSAAVDLGHQFVDIEAWPVSFNGLPDRDHGSPLLIALPVEYRRPSPSMVGCGQPEPDGGQ
jgi:hypothetical protein